MGLFARIREWWRPAPAVALPTTPMLVPPEVYGEIQSLKAKAEWMGRLLEDEERAFNYGDDGTLSFGMSQVQPGQELFSYGWAYNQCLYRPSYGACFCINEVQHRMIRARSRAFTSTNPYWHGVQHNLKTHVVGTGHTWQLVARDPKANIPDAKRIKAQKELTDFYASGYRQIQNEKAERKSRDGECFLWLLEEDQRLRVKFIEPLLVWTPPTRSESTGTWFGIQFKDGDYERPVGYFVRRMDLIGADTTDGAAWNRMITADKILHHKVNVDKGTPRGIPDTYWVQARLEQSLRTLRAMGTLVQVRAKIAMIRKRINALAGTVQPVLSANAAATVAGPGGQVRNVFQYPEGAILDTNDQAEYQFPGQNIETDKIVASVQADLQAVATSMGLADYMVSGSLGNGSYATAMVAEGPVVKTFEQHQQDMIDEDMLVATRVLQVAMDAGRIDADTLDVFKIVMNGPPLAGRDAIQDAQANHIYLQDGVISLTTVQQQLNLDPETERANKEKNPTTMAEAAEAAEQMAKDTLSAKTADTSTQPRNRHTSNARPFSASQEGRQKQRASGATREEEWHYGDPSEIGPSWGKEMLWALFQGRMQEHSGDDRSATKPTQEDMGMSAVLLTADWLLKTKDEILALPRFSGSPRDNMASTDYEPGVPGIRMGNVDGQEVWAVDMQALSIKHNCPSLSVAGNHAKWDFVPADKILVDWSSSMADRAADILHEVVETRLMDVGKWAYARAHRISGHFADQWLLVLRPELNALKPQE